MSHEQKKARRRKAGLGARIAATLVAVVVAFGLCEAGVRLVSPAPPEPGREPQLLFEPNADVGFLHVPTQMGWLDDGLATINEMGLRGELPEVPKAAGSVRVLAIGDSTTFGWGVGDTETYCAEVERLLRHEFPDRPLDVVNGGVAAYDLKHDALFLKHFAPILKPDIVLVGLFWNDLPYEQVSPEGAPLGPDSGASEEAAPIGSSPRTFRLGNQPSGWNRVLRSSRVLYTLRHAWLGAIAPTAAATNQVQWEMALLEGRRSAAIDKAWDDIKRTLQDIRDFAQVNKFAVGVVTMPIRAQVEGRFPQAQYQTRVKAMADSLGLFVIDPLPLFLQQPDHASLFIPFDRIHFSRRGNAEIADAVLEGLRARSEFAAPPTPPAGGSNGQVRTDGKS